MHAIASKRPERPRVRAVLVLLRAGGALLGGGALGCNREEKSVATVIEGRTNVEASAVVRADTDTAKRTDADSVVSVAVDAAPAVASASAPSERAAPVAHPADPSNPTRPPLTSDDLKERAAHLLDAVARNDPAAADDFFFPKAPFLPLKDVGDPARYFDQLLATYHRDIGSLHAERKDWTGVAFHSFELGTTPSWVAPGKESNKIGYFRTFGGKLRYRIGDKTKEIAVSTIISWDGRWYVTHLLPIRH